jgi:dynein heavy chain
VFSPQTPQHRRSSTPLFFILFPGYSPSKEIEAYARSTGRTVEAGNLTLISMGQGQEGPAEATLTRCAPHQRRALGWMRRMQVALCCV